jgi:uncharacterized protein DUF5005
MNNNATWSVALVILLLISCGSNNKTEPLLNNSTVRFDSIFYQKFQLSKPGFTGGDGVYSVALKDGRSVWIFGDTFIGEVTNEQTREKTNPMYIRNCFVVQNEDQMITVHKGKPEEFKSVMIPNEIGIEGKNERDIWFWPGDGFEYKNELNVFVSKFHQKTDDMWGFEFLETELVRFSLPDIVEIGKMKIPYSKEIGVHFGHAVLETKEYLYIYGLGNGKPYVARTTYENLNTQWEFFTGTNWVDDVKLAQPMIDFDGSEQFSISKINNQYVFVSQFGKLSKEVYSFISSTPFGPWTNKKLLFETPIDESNKNLFTYNALAHPQFTENNELLISYNTNSFELQDHFVNAGIYKPRFMRVPLRLIFEE